MSLESDPKVPPLIGVDFGGTKIEVAALDAQGTPVVRRRVATPSDYPSALSVVRELVTEVELQTAPVRQIGVGGCPWTTFSVLLASSALLILMTFETMYANSC
ncbi:MAG: ROK family protein [Gammaproteobacteria bacterium]|nr:ROK family protein [Gammaproteobacteria bacterium]